MIALIQSKAEGLWSLSQVRPNLIAGLIVGVVALPLAMAFAIASGARPEQGLYTAIVAAVLTALFGGTRTQISGPTGAFIAVLSIITAQHGIAGLQMATLMAGIILVAFGAAGLGSVIKFIPRPVIAGFTAGIGVIIFVGQWKDFFGLSPAPSGLRFHEKLWALIQAFPTMNPAPAPHQPRSRRKRAYSSTSSRDRYFSAPPRSWSVRWCTSDARRECWYCASDRCLSPTPPESRLSTT
jgi:SulP family sulfate permease